MPLLVIDTALEACQVGLLPGLGSAGARFAASGAILRSEILQRGHAERLPGMIAAALAEAGLSARDLSRIAVTVGPGSFAGLRIGVAAARALALVTGAEAVGLSTLAALAESARTTAEGRRILAVLAGRGVDVYAQLFDAGGDPLEPPRAIAFASLANEIADDIALAGSGADALAAHFPPGAAARILHRESAPRLAALMALAERAPPPTAPPRPLYLRPPDAAPMPASAAVARR